jgi:hypothetical protein
VPAAAVIPAPKAYIKVVAVKKLVVEPGRAAGARPRVKPGRARRAPPRGPPAGTSLGRRVRARVIYCEKIRVFKAGVPLTYQSMEYEIGPRFYFVGCGPE